jgi:hypothetical protein
LAGYNKVVFCVGTGRMMGKRVATSIRPGDSLMPGGIYLIQGDDSLVEMEEKAYDSEDLLQGLLAEYPNLLAGDQVDGAEPRRWLLISREMPPTSEEDGSG